MSIFSFLADLIGPVTGLVDDLHTSAEEKATLKNELYAMQAQLSVKVLEYEREIVAARASIITAEATSESWITRSWRPILMLAFGAAIIFNWMAPNILDMQIIPIPDDMWTVIKIGLAGYIPGRSIEKIVPMVLTRDVALP